MNIPFFFYEKNKILWGKKHTKKIFHIELLSSKFHMERRKIDRNSESFVSKEEKIQKIIEKNLIARFAGIEIQITFKLQFNSMENIEFGFYSYNCRKFPCRREIGWTLTLIGSSKVKMAEETDLQHLLQNADQLFDENQYQEAIDLLKKFPNQSDANILWREARALFKLSGTNKAKKEESIREGYELIQKALELDENNYACHKWMAVLLDAKSELDGIKVRVGQLANVKKHMQKAVDLNSEDPTNWHLLGNFAFGLADMPWYQRKIVSAIFATPPTGTYEEALDYFLKAEEKKANFYSMNLLFIGKCYYNMKNNEKAKEFITRAANVQVVNEDDKKCKEEATALLKKL